MRYLGCDMQGKRLCMMKVVNGSSVNFTELEYMQMIQDFADMCSEKSDTNFYVEVMTNKKEVKHNMDIQIIKKKAEGRISKHCKLSDDVVQLIINLYKDGYTKYEISKALGISRNTVNKYLKHT